MTIQDHEKAKLRQILADRLDLEELKNLAFDLGVDPQYLPGTTKSELSRELMSYFVRRNTLNLLVDQILSKRSDIESKEFLDEPPKKLFQQKTPPKSTNSLPTKLGRESD